MIKQFCQIGLLFLLSIGLVKAIDYKIGLGKNKIIGLIQIKDNRTPTDNSRQSTSQQTKK